MSHRPIPQDNRSPTPCEAMTPPSSPRATHLLARLLLGAAWTTSALLAGPTSGAGQGADTALLTAPERSAFIETTRYDDVLQLMEEVARISPLIELRTFGYSFEGRPLPLAVVSTLPDPTPAAIRESGRTIVYLQGNIHAGEVEGKEVLLMLLREVAQGSHRPLLDSLVLLVAPIFNADGNERVTLTNRGAQHGPLGGMGTRPNAQGLNINRDHMKLDSPEARAFALLLREYDPHLAMDLHTTNGTTHAYHLTYSPPLHPNTDPDLLELARDRLLPAAQRGIRAETGWESYAYGNLQGSGETRGWYTFDHRPRFNNNYLGLRNRIGILSEAYSYATFEERIAATRAFVDQVLAFAHHHGAEIRTLTERADAHSIIGSEMAVRATYARSPEMVEILMGGVTEETNPYSGATIRRRTEERRPEWMWEFGQFAGTAFEVVPTRYLVPEGLGSVLELLRAHGVDLRPLPPTGDLSGPAPLTGVERFRITDRRVAGAPFEGRLELTVEGSWEAGALDPSQRYVEVPMDQPLARLIFLLLEPRSDDGLTHWGTLTGALQGQDLHPILRGR